MIVVQLILFENIIEVLLFFGRFVFAIPPVMAPRIKMHASHPSPTWTQKHRHLEFTLSKELKAKTVMLHKINSKMTVQFPELRLIEYDCGKFCTVVVIPT